MNDDNTASNEIDLELMAYIDGLLNEAPLRKRAVERRIADDPALAELVRTIRAQNNALRDAYAGMLLDAPVPERLTRALETPDRLPASLFPKLAAVAAIVILAAGGGWYAGYDTSADDERIATQFLEQSYQRFVETESLSVGDAASVSTDMPVNWLSNRLSLRLQAPDLQSKGYAIVGQETVKVGDVQMVRLVYAAANGETFSLFLRPRWESGHREVRVVTENDVSLAVWLDGPLAATLAGKLPRERLNELVGIVRDTMHDSNETAPEIKPAPGTEQSADLSARQQHGGDTVLQPAGGPSVLSPTSVPKAPFVTN
ncbi:MAG: hypothetical protein RH946_05805 [Rhodospirillales bacterium]